MGTAPLSNSWIIRIIYIYIEPLIGPLISTVTERGSTQPKPMIEGLGIRFEGCTVQDFGVPSPGPQMFFGVINGDP